MTLSSFSDLVSLLERDDVAHRADPLAQTVVIPTALGTLSGELLMRWEATSHIFQCIHPLPFDVPPERLSAVADAIARVNHALLLPGFGLDHVGGIVYFRLSVPRELDGTMTDDAVRRLFSTAVQTARDFDAPFRAVALEGGSPGDTVSAAQAMRQKP